MSKKPSATTTTESSTDYEIRRPKHDIKWYISYYRFKSKQFLTNHWKKILILLSWLGIGYLSHQYEFMIVFAIFTTIGLIFYNLDWREKSKEERERTLSAWSVFNKGFKSIPGTFTAEEQINTMTGGALNHRRH
ncbi:predicted protein [Naegleria gruberi]|uniref:Predicted protein n=1 Tax=Naegleria gruberi TaxID=5762 RepID=D2VBE9_NAEGR|nr:uncharacterized protein NAEGRDRAFT_66190 [Naegleria gruberi]EFC45785.1 predicted protein [Naegleria gruberi]|eukprot:XP_002678529.1 predicted protein [Naegleria gruberi strain NEG-M]